MLIAGAVISSTPGVRAAVELVDGINAVVHDSVVTFAEVQIMTLPAQEVLAREYRSQPEMYVKKVSDARNDSLEQLLERQLILRDFKVTFSQPERQALIEKEINKEVDQEIEAEIRARYRRQSHDPHPDLAGGGNHLGTASSANSRPDYHHLVAPEEHFF